MGQLQVTGTHRLDEWLARTDDPGRRESMLIWLKAASISPDSVITDTIDRVIDGRLCGRMHVSLVPGTSCVVTWTVTKAPVRSLLLYRFYDLQ